MLSQRVEKLAYLTKIVTVLDQKFWLSLLLPRTILLTLDTSADDVTTSGPSYRCGRQGRTREYKSLHYDSSRSVTIRYDSLHFNTIRYITTRYDPIIIIIIIIIIKVITLD